MKTTVKLPKNYQNNPFFVATDGIELLFKKAKTVGVALAIFTAVYVLSSYTFPAGPPAQAPTEGKSPASDQADMNFINNIPPEFLAIGGLAILILLIIFAFFCIIYSGFTDYTSAKLARGKEVHFKEALGAIFTNFWPYTWLLVVVGAKLFLWTLLLIIPGFVMAYRYSLSGVSYFDKGLRGNAATKYSADLTKGAWLTTFGSHTLLNLITFGVIQPLVTPGANAILYRQFEGLKEKPKAHGLAWLALLLPIFIIILIIFAGFMLAWAFMNYKSVAP